MAEVAGNKGIVVKVNPRIKMAHFVAKNILILTLVFFIGAIAIHELGHIAVQLVFGIPIHFVLQFDGLSTAQNLESFPSYQIIIQSAAGFVIALLAYPLMKRLALWLGWNMNFLRKTRWLEPDFILPVFYFIAALLASAHDFSITTLAIMRLLATGA